jgi:hypothetical protein
LTTVPSDRITVKAMSAADESLRPSADACPCCRLMAISVARIVSITLRLMSRWSSLRTAPSMRRAITSVSRRFDDWAKLRILSY